MNQNNDEEQFLREFNDGYTKDLAYGMSWYNDLNDEAKNMFLARILELIRANTPDHWDQRPGPGADNVPGPDEQVKAYMVYKLALLGFTTLIWLVANEKRLPDTLSEIVQTAHTPGQPRELTAAIQTILEWMAKKKLGTIRFTGLDADINGKVAIVVAAAIGDKCDDLMTRTDRLGRDGGNDNGNPDREVRTR